MIFKALRIALTCLAFPFAAFATPYCDALLDSDALPSKYARLAPIHSSTETGWIFTDEMLSEEYEMKESNLALVQGIVDAFAERRVPLAIVVAPPRSIVAGQDVVDATVGKGAHDVAAARASFEAMIAQLRSTGAIVPDLVAVATSSDAVRQNYYFKRDTHWSAIGAAFSMQALSAEVAAAHPALDIQVASAPTIGPDTEEEKGSLAAIVRQVCKADLPRETFALSDFPSRGGDLLGASADSAPVVLLGTSFSNRYKTDLYRVGDALAWALDREVENLSATGTGMIGVIEGFVLNGGLDREPSLVVWEVPYSESFNAASNLRQLLGALRTAEKTPGTLVASTQGDAQLEFGAVQPDLLIIRSGNTDPIDLRVRVELASGATKTIKLRRRDRVPTGLRGDTLAASLTGFSSDILSIEVDVKSGASLEDLRLEAHRSITPSK
ncbi:alginate O-acetyltransferase AlgX-related protein [Roseobacter sp. MH60115]|uniref:alginate O-acetyltransferase AlgX-related protein n=1 Tax=Roseobacter sp. MH60115 TaxID=2785324 RepID=UPI0018A2E97F|nr:hypothetical protein [Roseobacter sp. MH60115]